MCKEHSRQNPWKGRMVGKGWLASEKNPVLTLRKTEDLSYGRLMIFSRETLYDFFKLLKQTIDAIKLHQWLHLIYNVDEIGLQLTYISDSQNQLPVNANKKFTMLLTEEKGKL
jgi:hypothetical protein